MLSLLLSCWLGSLCPMHDDTESLAVLEAASSAWTLRIDVDADRAMQTLGVDEPDGTVWTARDVQAKEPALLEYLATHFRLERDGEPWPLRPQRVDLHSGLDPVFGVRRPLRLEAHFQLRPPQDDFSLVVQQDLFLDTETAHRHRFRWQSGPEAPEFGVFPGLGLKIDVEDPTEEGRLARRDRYFFAGFRAARNTPWTMLLLVIAGLGARSFLRVLATGFSFLAACAGTATLAALGHVEPSARLVELAAPFSVAYVAAENLWTQDRRHRWATAGLFGCVSGLGLDRLLREHGLPEMAAESCALGFTAGCLTTLTIFFLALSPLVRLGSAESTPARVAARVVSAAVAVGATVGLVRAF